MVAWFLLNSRPGRPKGKCQTWSLGGRSMPVPAVLGGLIAKVGALGATTKAVAATAVATAGFGVTGAAGVLPQSVQEPFDRAVHTIVATDDAADIDEPDTSGP